MPQPILLYKLNATPARAPLDLTGKHLGVHSAGCRDGWGALLVSFSNLSFSGVFLFLILPENSHFS